jgi:uncharacterized protein YhbP (UPF0306 family)
MSYFNTLFAHSGVKHTLWCFSSSGVPYAASFFGLSDVKFEYKATIQNKENTGNHTEISCIKEEVEVNIVAESQRPQMT